MMLNIQMLQDWETLSMIVGTVAQIIQAIVLLIGLPFLVIQIRQQTSAIKLQTDSIKLSNFMELMTLNSSGDDMLIGDAEILGFYDEHKLPKNLSGNWTNLSTKFRKQYLYLGRLVNQSERSYVLWKLGWISDTDYRALLMPLKEVLELKKFELWWGNLKPYYRQDFTSYVDDLRSVHPDKFFEFALSKSSSLTK
jgi:hypothetical protein